MTKLIAIVLMIFTAILHMLFGSPRVYAAQEPDPCESIHVGFDDRPAAEATETFSIPKASAGAFRVSFPKSSGIEVTGWDRDAYEVTVCKAALDRATLDRVRVRHDGGDVAVSGPEGEEWNVFLVVRAPKDASFDLESHNGPVGFRGVSGKIRARSGNGPLSFEGCDAEIVARTSNGPISFTGNRSHADLRAENGPVTVNLEGRDWEDGSLTAATRNGPVSLTLQSGFRSGVDVRSSGHAPFACGAAACGSAERSWGEENRSVHFGGAKTVVSVSTVNGPVSIGSRRNEI